jgi:hypothetical protein
LVREMLNETKLVDRLLISVMMSLPAETFQLVVLIRLASAVAKGRLVLLGVVLPVSPLIVMVGRPAAGVLAQLSLHELRSGTLDCSCTVIVLGAHGHGVVWLAVAVPQTSGKIVSGAFKSPADLNTLELELNGQACTDTAEAFFDFC